MMSCELIRERSRHLVVTRLSHRSLRSILCTGFFDFSVQYWDENEIFVSSLVSRGDRWNERVSQVNNILKANCNREGLPFIDNSDIVPAYHLNRSNLHLNSEGTRMLANNFLRALGHY